MRALVVESGQRSRRRRGTKCRLMIREVFDASFGCGFGRRPDLRWQVPLLIDG